MTKNKFKAILFAGLIAAMILPFSSMDMVEAAPNDNANEKAKEMLTKDTFRNTVIEVHDKRSQMLNLKEVNKDVKLAASDKIKNERAIEALQESIDKKMPTLEQYEKQRKAFYFIEPAREQYLLSIVEDLRADVYDFGSSVEMVSYGVNIDYATKGIKVGISDESYNNKIQNIIDKHSVPNVEIVLYNGVAGDASCDSNQSNCNPIVGGIRAQGEDHTGDCTVGLPIKDGTVKGFITAGHCINDNEKLHQPLVGWFNQIGDSSVSHYISNCDCAFVKQTSGDTIHSWALRSANNYLLISSEASSIPTQGTQVVMFGEQSGFQQGEVLSASSQYTYNGVNWDLASLDITIAGGDSGAPVTNASGNQILGIIKGWNIDTNDPVMTAWSVIDTKFGVNLIS